jgi:MFS family permease
VAARVDQPVDTRGPIAQVLALDGYRRYWTAQLLISIVSGTVRFAFVWLLLDLTSWKSAVPLMGFSLGVPITLITLPAGVMSDRYDRRSLVTAGAAVGAGILSATAVLVGLGSMSVFVSMCLAFGAAGVLAAVAPSLQAMVPSLVPKDLLMTGIALQGLGQNTAQLAGVLVGGVAIESMGVARAFGLLAVFLVAAAVLMRSVPEVAAGPRRRHGGALTTVRRSIFDGARFVRSLPVLRSVVLVALLGGTCGGVNQLLLTAIARQEMGKSAFTASLLFGGLGFGMILTTLGLARRPGLKHPGRLLALWFFVTCGPGLILMGATTHYMVAMAGMLIWGLGGGFVMTTQRTLIQRNTSDELMGRVISVHTLALTGSYPLAAAIAFGLGGLLERRAILVAIGIVSGVLAGWIAWRSPLRDN